VTDPDPVLLDATAQLELLAAGALSAAELLERHLARRDAVDGPLGAIVDVDLDRARADAARVDADRAAGRPLGPLAGIPITVKDAFDVAGMRTSHGRLSDAHRATADAPAVARLRAAGAIPYGKTNVPVLLADYQTANADFGRTRNPWDAARTAGGSSGGSAVAVASGLSALDLGSDLAGSIRMPAAWNGVFGHRPSNGLVSKLGHLPWPTDGLLEPPVSVSGPLARSARDLDLVVPLLAERTGLPAPRIAALRGARIGVWTDAAVAPVEPEMRAALAALADALAHAGCTVVEIHDPPGADADGLALFARLEHAEIAFSLDDATWALAQAAREDDGPTGEWARLVTRSVRDATRDAADQRLLSRRWSEEVFSRVDVVIAPAVPGAAPLSDERPSAGRVLEIDGVVHRAPEAVSAWSRLVGLGMLPATVVPLGPGAASALPLGAQLIGPFLGDRTTLGLAVLLEQAGLVRFDPAPDHRTGCASVGRGASRRE
jgi:amidase